MDAARRLNLGAYCAFLRRNYPHLWNVKRLQCDWHSGTRWRRYALYPCAVLAETPAPLHEFLFRPDISTTYAEAWAESKTDQELTRCYQRTDFLTYPHGVWSMIVEVGVWWKYAP